MARASKDPWAPAVLSAASSSKPTFADASAFSVAVVVVNSFVVKAVYIYGHFFVNTLP